MTVKLDPRLTKSPLRKEPTLPTPGASSLEPTAKAPPSTTSKAPTKTPTTTAPLLSKAQEAPKSAGQSGAPSWATPESMQAIASKLKPTSTSVPTGGSGLQVRLGAMTQKLAPTPEPKFELAKTSRSLLERAIKAATVIGGRPMSPAEIAANTKAVHLTRATSVAPILSEGVRPTTSPLANWSTWMKKAVYMFPSPPQRGSFEDSIVRSQKMTEVIEVDLTKLDPDKLFKRVLDGAIVYLSDEPLPTASIAHAGHLDDYAQPERVV